MGVWVLDFLSSAQYTLYVDFLIAPGWNQSFDSTSEPPSK